MIDLHAIEKICETTLGGITTIIVFNIENVNVSGAGTQTGDINLIDPAKIWRLHFKSGTANYKETASDSKNGISYQHSLVCDVPRARLTMEELARKIRNRRIGALYIDRQGFQRYLLNYKCLISYSSDSTSRGFNGYKISLTRKSTKEAHYIAGNIDIGISEGGTTTGGTNTGGTTQSPIDKYFRATNYTGRYLQLPWSLPQSSEINSKIWLFRDSGKLGYLHPEGFKVVDLTTASPVPQLNAEWPTIGLEFYTPIENETIEIIYKS